LFFRPYFTEDVPQFHIGTLVDAPLRDAAPVEVDDDPAAPFLNPKKWKQAVLQDIKTVNHDSAIFRFSLQGADQPLGLPTGQHVFVRLKRKDTGEMIQRAYTPVSREDAAGHIDFLIKMYLPNEKFPEGGKMTTGFHQLVIGEHVELKGPLGSFVWQGRGTAMIKNVKRTFKEIAMVCAGSGE
jgi:nitrate reductase (NAD(P)H)